MSKTNQKRISVDDVTAYLQAGNGWEQTDDAAKSRLWKRTDGSEFYIVQPLDENLSDYDERIEDALRVLAYVERRRERDIQNDIAFGGSDSLSVRLLPHALSGEAPLELAHSVISGLKNLVVGSAAGLEANALVLPRRRPARAETYANKTLVSTEQGSFVVNLSLPLADPSDPTTDNVQLELVEQPTTPHSNYGREVSSRMILVVRNALNLAKRVGDGETSVREFGQAGARAGNATELAALASLGGVKSERTKYFVRFTQSPLSQLNRISEPLTLSVTPAQQLILAEASDYLRTEQPRSDVTIIGLVVRLVRNRTSGPGEVVIQGSDDDSGATRRYRVGLSEPDYDKAIKAHESGLQAVALGDLITRGTIRTLGNIRSFDVLPDIESGN